MNSAFCVYGQPLAELAEIPAGAVQASPLIPGSAAREEIAPESLFGMAIAAPPGTLERRYVLALALRALAPGARLTVLAPNEKGGNRLAKELEAFGCVVDTVSKRHHRICRAVRPEVLHEEALDAAFEGGRARFVEDLGQWSQPGVFSWDAHDPGTLLLMSVLPHLAGRGADLGCGIGLLATAALANPDVTHLDLIDIDRRAVECARRNLKDGRAAFHWADARLAPALSELDFVVMNPPFHDGGAEDRSLGQAFVRRSHQILRKGGAAWLVANRHLPYEGVMKPLFSTVTLHAEAQGFKVYEART